MESTWKNFDRAYGWYVEGYHKQWVEYLESLNGRCKKLELYKVIQPEVEKFLQESYKQYEILLQKSYRANADVEFVLPMLEYHSLMKTYYAFAMQLLKETKCCYWPRGYVCNQPALNDINFILDKENDALKGTKENIENHLYSQELLRDVEKLVSVYIKNNDNGLIEGISKYYKVSKEEKLDQENEESKKAKEEITKKEIGNVILFMLEHLKKLLSNKFKEKKTYFERNKEELEQIRKARKEAERKAKEEAQGREEEKKGRLKAEAEKSKVEARARKLEEKI
ncbi:cell envelope integrity protein TolA [Wolbachia endosymbiont of Pentidionis agamae]|uniref:cell envelope integrity protein TolA n=1 Tax=Wolbachia endosymbiont of Pentidionis agamae TaxID=3110435 RepID=UPI002FCF47D0